MSPKELVDKLDQMGIIEARVLKKMRREVDNPEKNPSIKGVLTYLVKRGHLPRTKRKNSSVRPKRRKMFCTKKWKSTNPLRPALTPTI